MDISLGKSRKRYTRDMSFDNNTTFGFGDVQPLMCQYMLPNSDISVSTNQLVRLSPLIAPSFARINLYTTARFVPISDIYPNYESFLSGKPVSSSNGSQFIPEFVPYIKGNFFLFALLRYCEICITSDLNGLVQNINVPGYLGTVFNFLTGQSSSLIGSSFDSIYPAPSATFKGYDYYDFVISYTTSSGLQRYLFARINDFRGSILRKIFVGLGYSLSPYFSASSASSYLNLSVLPLLAYYRAWYDTYAPRRVSDFQQTYCYACIQYSSLSSDSSFCSTATITRQFLNFLIKELAACYYTSDDDYLSIHTTGPVNVPDDTPENLVVVGNNTVTVGSDAPNAIPSVINPTSLDITILDGLRRFSKFVAKDSVIGQRISTWVRNHFSSDVVNQLFKDSNLVYRDVMPLPISDVFSTSDTAQGTGESSTGESLGAYAGKGIGYGKGSFKFHSSVHGYLIVFATIAPVSRTYQGVAAPLMALSRFSQPFPEFDALGYEITDKRVFFDTNDYLNVSTPWNSASFGYVPRYTGFKYNKDIVNGDMSRRSTYDSMSPYFLDRTFRFVELNNSVSPGAPFFGSIDVPVASESWRYITRYNYLSNFNRIFINNDDASSYDENDETNIDYFTTDNFIGQFIFNVKLTDSLKPLKQSYDTVSSEDNVMETVKSV